MYAQITRESWLLYNTWNRLPTSVVTSDQCATMTRTPWHCFLGSFNVREISSRQTLWQKQSEYIDKDADPAWRHLDPDWRPVLAIVLQYRIRWSNIEACKDLVHILDQPLLARSVYVSHVSYVIPLHSAGMTGASFVWPDVYYPTHWVFLDLLLHSPGPITVHTHAPISEGVQVEWSGRWCRSRQDPWEWDGR